MKNTTILDYAQGEIKTCDTQIKKAQENLHIVECLMIRKLKN